MDLMSEHHKAKLLQNNTKIQMYLELLMLAVTKVIMLSSSGDTHQDTHRTQIIHHALHQGEIENLKDY